MWGNDVILTKQMLFSHLLLSLVTVFHQCACLSCLFPVSAFPAHHILLDFTILTAVSDSILSKCFSFSRFPHHSVFKHSFFPQSKKPLFISLQNKGQYCFLMSWCLVFGKWIGG